MGDQVIPQRQRRTQHGEQPPAQTAVGEQGRVELVPPGVRVLREPDQGSQRRVGVRRARQRPQPVDVCLVVVVVPAQLRQTLARWGSTNPSRPTLGSLGRCVAGLVTTRR